MLIVRDVVVNEVLDVPVLLLESRSRCVGDGVVGCGCEGSAGCACTTARSRSRCAGSCGKCWMCLYYCSK